MNKFPVVETFVAGKPSNHDVITDDVYDARGGSDSTFLNDKLQPKIKTPQMLQRIKTPEQINNELKKIEEENQKRELILGKETNYTRLIFTIGIAILTFIVLRSGKGILSKLLSYFNNNTTTVINHVSKTL
jgi:hypothetical protein